jgi:hypothetical protein
VREASSSSFPTGHCSARDFAARSNDDKGHFLIAPMFSDHDEYDRRRHPRVPLGLAGSMAFGPCVPRRTCIIMNISEGGARLDIGLLLDPPQRFGLSLLRSDYFQCEGRLVWHSEFEIGVKFI